MPRSWLLGFVAKRTVAESYKRLTSPLIRLQRLSSCCLSGLEGCVFAGGNRAGDSMSVMGCRVVAPVEVADVVGRGAAGTSTNSPLGAGWTSCGGKPTVSRPSWPWPSGIGRNGPSPASRVGAVLVSENGNAAAEATRELRDAVKPKIAGAGVG